MRQLPYSQPDEASDGWLVVKPSAPTRDGPLGMHALELGGVGEAFVYAPQGYRPEQPAPLALLCHGAGGNAQAGFAPLLSLADESGIVLLAPSSRASTWDIITGAYGPDVALIDRALAEVFARYAIDTQHLAIGGFSDGASYALSLGIANGQVFSHIIAFSPGFMAPSRQEGAPRIFISHGTRDAVLPINRCSRVLVPRLKRAKYNLEYREFDGPHTVPAEIARDAMAWFTGKE